MKKISLSLSSFEKTTWDWSKPFRARSIRFCFWNNSSRRKTSPSFSKTGTSSGKKTDFCSCTQILIFNDLYIYHTYPHWIIVTFDEGVPLGDPNLWRLSTTFFPSVTFPKTVCFPSSHGHATKVMKNWDPLVLRPAFAIDNK